MPRRKLLQLFLLLSLVVTAVAQSGGELRFNLRTEPKTFNPILVQDDSSETVRYLTGGVLARVNRKTQQLEPGLATSWKIMNAGKTIRFKLREGLSFSDGTPFSNEDVAFTMKQLMDPAVHSPTGDAFRSGTGAVKTDTGVKNSIDITFPAPVAGLDKLFDQVAIMSSKSQNKEKAVLGPFMVAEYKPGAYLLLMRNPHYWKKDSAGKQLPYLDSVRLEILQNGDAELLRFKRGEFHLMNSLSAEAFDRLSADYPQLARDLGPALDTEQFWFNQVAKSPIPAYKIQWFRSINFRRAMSSAINREDIARLVYGKHARPASSLVSPANQFWFNSKLKPHPFDRKDALARLAQDGFKLDGKTLRDRDGHAVEFSIITNSGNKSRERIATLIQQDLSEIGIRVSVVTLDFPSLIERITQSFNYEACILGLVNTDLDPMGQMNVWLSSSENHQWNPSQKSPETPWEAEIDRLMKAQASEIDARKRKQSFDKVQEIVWEQEPFLYLINKNALVGVSAALRNVEPVAIRPQTYWNVDYIALSPEASKR